MRVHAEPDLRWKRTWDDDLEREDYTAWHGGRQFGRVYRGDQGNWQWFAAWALPGGMERSRRAAMAAVEDAYLSFITRDFEAAETYFRQRLGAALKQTSKTQ